MTDLQTRKHEYPFKMVENSIMNNVTGCLLQEPGILMMTDTGSPLKIGEYSACEQRFNEIMAKIPSDLMGDYELVRFNVAYPELGFNPEGYNLTPTEICALFNYLMECHIGGEGWKELKSLSLDELRAKLAKVATWFE